VAGKNADGHRHCQSWNDEHANRGKKSVGLYVGQVKDERREADGYMMRGFAKCKRAKVRGDDG